MIVRAIERSKMAVTPAEQAVFLNRKPEKANTLKNYRAGFNLFRKLVATRHPQNLTPHQIDSLLIKAVTTNFFAGEGVSNSRSLVYGTCHYLQVAPKLVPMRQWQILQPSASQL